MRTGSMVAVALVAALGHGAAQAQERAADLGFMETCRAERGCVCDSLDGWFACVADAPALAARGGFDAEALVASIVSEADRHLARDCTVTGQASIHRLCQATLQLREIAAGPDPTQAFLDTDFDQEPQVDAPNDEWRLFLEGLRGGDIEIGGGGLGGLGAGSAATSAPVTLQQQQGGNRVAAADAMRRGGSPQTASIFTPAAVGDMCRSITEVGSDDPAWAECIPGVCNCPSTIRVPGRGVINIGDSATIVCNMAGYGIGDLADKAPEVLARLRAANGGATAMLTLLGITASVLDAVAKNAAPILCGHGRNSTYISDDCINNFSGAECQGARLALACLGCGETGVRECSARCLCFWQALSNYNQDRRRRESRLCRTLGIGCPDDKGYFYRLGMSCLNPPPGGIRRGGGGGYR